MSAPTKVDSKSNKHAKDADKSKGKPTPKEGEKNKNDTVKSKPSKSHSISPKGTSPVNRPKSRTMSEDVDALPLGTTFPLAPPMPPASAALGAPPLPPSPTLQFMDAGEARATDPFLHQDPFGYPHMGHRMPARGFPQQHMYPYQGGHPGHYYPQHQPPMYASPWGPPPYAQPFMPSEEPTWADQMSQVSGSASDVVEVQVTPDTPVSTGQAPQGAASKERETSPGAPAYKYTAVALNN